MQFSGSLCAGWETSLTPALHAIYSPLKARPIKKTAAEIEMAKQLKTSRSQLDRLLDPENDKVTLVALSRAAKAIGRSLRLELQ